MPNPTPDAEKIAALAKLAEMRAAKAPMIWVGTGAIEASAEVLALAEKVGAPVVGLRTGRGHRRQPPSARHHRRRRGEAVQTRPTCIVGIGTRLDLRRRAGAGHPGRAEAGAHRHRSGGGVGGSKVDLPS
jgi:acetolactate synthase-1/2/3 large subunit